MGKCPNCGAPLPAGVPDAVEHCTFCGAETREKRKAREAPAPRAYRDADLEAAFDKGMRGYVRSTIVFGALVIGAGIAIAIVTSLAKRPTSTSSTSWLSSPSPSSPSSSSAAPRAPSVLTPATLATMPGKALASTPFDATGVVGDYAAFDLVGNLDWASGVAKAWSLDATLWRVYAQHAGLDGTIDLSPGGTANVILEYNSLTKGDVNLMLEIHAPRGMPASAPGAHVSVSISTHRDTTARDRLPTPTCSLSKVFATAKSHGLSDASPLYGASLALVVDRDKAYWSVQYAVGKITVKGAETWVDARTCALAHPP